MRRVPAMLLVMTICLSMHAAGQECAHLHNSLNSAADVAESGGWSIGVNQFAPGINGEALTLSGDNAIGYGAGSFGHDGGAFAFWFKPNAATHDGGIVQLGELGQPNSVGVFHSDGDNIVFEARNANGLVTAITAQNALNPDQWTHVVATWNRTSAGRQMWLFVGGAYINYALAPGSFNHTNSALQLGRTGFWEFGVGTLDEFRYFDSSLTDGEVYAERVYSANDFIHQPTGKPVSTGPVQVFGKHIYLHGKPFFIRGVGYQPTPVGQYPWTYSVYTDANILARDMPLLRAMNVNTIRTWGAIPNNQLLDALQADPDHPIYALLAYYIPHNADFGNPAVIAQYEAEFRNFVRQFKDHPAVLGWLIGNEVNLSNSGQRLRDWYALANRLAQVAYEEEGANYHPTVLVNTALDYGSVANLADDASLNYVDVWGHNTYFGWDAGCYFTYFDRISAKPLIMTEYGVDAWDSDNNRTYLGTQAAIEVDQWRQLEVASAGGTIMAYSDEWWKDQDAGNPWAQSFGGYSTGNHPDGFSNEEWYGVMAIQDNGADPDIMIPRLAYHQLTVEYAYEPGDIDQDQDVDLTDFAEFQSCVGGFASYLCGTVFDFEVDDTVDNSDAEFMTRRLNGPDRSVNLN